MKEYFHSKIESKIGPEFQEGKELEQKELVKNAEKALKDYLGLSSQEKILLMDEQTEHHPVLDIISKAAQGIGASVEEWKIEGKVSKEELLEHLSKNQVIILPFDTEKEKYGDLVDIYDEIEKSDSRMAVLIDVEPDVFMNKGAMIEDIEELEERLNRMKETLKPAHGFRITTRYGTDLKFALRPEHERGWFCASGRIKKGEWDNLPGGEVYTSPCEGGVTGVLVLPNLETSISKQIGVEEFVRVGFYQGKIIWIEGGKSAELLRKELEKISQLDVEKGYGVQNVLTCAELAFGGNIKARDLTEGAATTEAEKRLGTIHLAVGDNHFGEDVASGKNSSYGHYDFVIPRLGLTLEMFTSDEDFKKEENGRKVIDEGRWRLIQ